mmetsp:Transcript_18561/g.43652  ORF Transcript_18561/g.43652 Transcript_18561/m.43652 type:complete len:256 (+) Transcript_18561:1211-1978(+)
MLPAFALVWIRGNPRPETKHEQILRFRGVVRVLLRGSQKSGPRHLVLDAPPHVLHVDRVMPVCIRQVEAQLFVHFLQRPHGLLGHIHCEAVRFVEFGSAGVQCKRQLVYLIRLLDVDGVAASKGKQVGLPVLLVDLFSSHVSTQSRRCVVDSHLVQLILCELHELLIRHIAHADVERKQMIENSINRQMIDLLHQLPHMLTPLFRQLDLLAFRSRITIVVGFHCCVVRGIQKTRPLQVSAEDGPVLHIQHILSIF